MSALTEVIAHTLATHRMKPGTYWNSELRKTECHCACGEAVRFSAWEVHVADAVVAALKEKK